MLCSVVLDAHRTLIGRTKGNKKILPALITVKVKSQRNLAINEGFGQHSALVTHGPPLKMFTAAYTRSPESRSLQILLLLLLQILI